MSSKSPMHTIPFSKYTGCGNDFILIDHRASFWKMIDRDMIMRLCRRHLGIGADGVILLEKNLQCDFSMRIFNSDGNEAEMCGNGLRCLAKFILELGFEKKPYTIKTMERMLTVDYVQDQIKTEMGAPVGIKLDFPISIEQQRYHCSFINTGVPHTVIFVNSLDDLSVDAIGAKIRHHAAFSPSGTNVNFAMKTGPSELSIRTFERGVEAETLACGTGVAASAIAACLKWNLKGPIQVKVRSSDLLEIDFIQDDKGNISHVSQTGPARKLFHGVFDMRGYL